MSQPTDWKAKGIEAYANHKYALAAAMFTKAIDQQVDDAKLYSNRSAAYLELQQYEEALKDAQTTINLDPRWSKGYLRKGNIHQALNQWTSASDEYSRALSCEPDNLEFKQLVDHTQRQCADQSSSFQVFLDWLTQHGAKFPLLYLQDYQADYRGVHVKRNVPQNLVCLEIPLPLIMTSQLAKQSEIGTKLLKCPIASSHSYLACYLIEEKYKGSSSFWKPYLDILPKTYRNMPIYFNQLELDELKGSFTLYKIADRHDELKSEYTNIIQNVPEFHGTYDEFVWARMVVITRIFGFEVDQVKMDGLVPMADMLNHKNPRETDWLFDDKRNAFTITTLKPVKAFEPLFDSYGRKCNSRFFVNYGFCLDNNEEDNQVALFFRMDRLTDPLYQTKLLLMSTKSNNNNTVDPVVYRYQVSIVYSEETTLECFSFLRLLHANEAEMSMIPQGHLFNLKRIQPLSIRNEMCVLQSLKQEAQRMYSKFPTTLEQDDQLLQQTDLPAGNIRNCILMRKSEKQVLQFYIQLYDKMVQANQWSLKQWKRYIHDHGHVKPKEALKPLVHYTTQVLGSLLPLVFPLLKKIR